MCCFVVGATGLLLTESPQSAVREGSTATFKCLSDEANPPPLIWWNQGDSIDKVKPGRFNAKAAESTQIITGYRTMNKQEIICFIKADPEKNQMRLEQKFTLTVECESFYYFI